MHVKYILTICHLLRRFSFGIPFFSWSRVGGKRFQLLLSLAGRERIKILTSKNAYYAVFQTPLARMSTQARGGGGTIELKLRRELPRDYTPLSPAQSTAHVASVRYARAIAVTCCESRENRFFCSAALDSHACTRTPCAIQLLGEPRLGMSKIGYFFWHLMLLALLLLSLNNAKYYALFAGKCQKC